MPELVPVDLLPGPLLHPLLDPDQAPLLLPSLSLTAVLEYVHILRLVLYLLAQVFGHKVDVQSPLPRILPQLTCLKTETYHWHCQKIRQTIGVEELFIIILLQQQQQYRINRELAENGIPYCCYLKIVSHIQGS